VALPESINPRGCYGYKIFGLHIRSDLYRITIVI